MLFLRYQLGHSSCWLSCIMFCNRSAWPLCKTVIAVFCVARAIISYISKCVIVNIVGNVFHSPHHWMRSIYTVCNIRLMPCARFVDWAVGIWWHGLHLHHIIIVLGLCLSTGIFGHFICYYVRRSTYFGFRCECFLLRAAMALSTRTATWTSVSPSKIEIDRVHCIAPFWFGVVDHHLLSA